VSEVYKDEELLKSIEENLMKASVKKDEEFIGCVKECADKRMEQTALEKSGTWHGVIYKADGSHYGSKQFKKKKHAIAYTQYAEHIGWTVVLYKRFASYKSEVPVIKGD